ncbi:MULTISPECIES: tRNA uridine-5-carboxymethylaminomethyl(34) synthesis GTPase MnmE [Legionella]|uniref:tRNA modification GTPase MnmE n=1 Tax=Legionella septentrionalis TaxID=2498109 RepID=A0A433JLZ9_9GAMM|nr:MULTISPECIES: tRNA uridine-5-carboxymethylaminomethyl(34) synthesis GTPase MnmE [Legionella]MCP0914839.1 tRNA uridine-5-carboxymethylaminomethyl(34) synthesis GTPase MnmE [Legionella sp. 27cVA30]RUQ91026.1 tRNA uridine-5-carboxymethylaminomethyl(34) synthesis GTPase MnmE [Legionella septentrionalis]RUR02904.1 tRNA uridine-5-carboxymethylaminomethyl(34) synthesis GTPase MnmE [Legionella septentrionalis]RUR11503.1 tRNA uridine-5-carboxymethylaminomethyl(34) synthesis GTPase MnmE [Legionella se
MMVDTIVAVATPPGRGGVGIVRLSGPLACTIAQSITKQKNMPPRLAVYCTFHDQSSQIIDQGIAIYFKAPHSFTGDDVVELQGHGAPIVLDKLVAVCAALGARLAKPGEFSERAFLNNKIDLTQAEAIADLIHATSETAARLAMRSLQGEFSARIHNLNEQLIQLRLYVEAAIDFPEEEIDFLSDGKIAAQLARVIQELVSIKKNAAQGVILREGLSVVIAGRPNAGKSTLINALSGKEVAIVTDIAGTTRDVMREHVLLDDIPVHLIDTAGLRESDDPVEKEGIRRAWDEVERADCVLFVIDANEVQHEVARLDAEIRKALPAQVPILRVYNKIDQSGKIKSEADAVYISAKTGEGLIVLKEKIKEMVGYHAEEGQFLARRRHLQALDAALNFLCTGQEQLTLHKAGELLAEDLRLAHQALCEITGEFTSDDLLGKIFSSFCIGK